MLHGEEAELTGRVAAKPSSLYGREVIAYTRGRGHLTLVPCGYEPCPEQEKAVALCSYEPERDTWNPADSVFCSHGSGTVIPWNESDPMMHIQLESERPQTVTDAPVPRPERRREDEEELQAIFERTYGSVRKNAFRPTPRREDNTARREFLPPLEEYLLVDGYNIIFAWEELKELAHRDLASARQKLIDILSDYHGMHPCSLLLVYDSYKVSGARGTQEEEGGITVVYTKEGETADSFIEREVTRLAKQYRVRAATSDRCEQNIILGAGALRMSARELRGEVEAAKVEIRRIMERQSKRDGKASLGRALEKAVNKQR